MPSGCTPAVSCIECQAGRSGLPARPNAMEHRNAAPRQVRSAKRDLPNIHRDVFHRSPSECSTHVIRVELSPAI